MPRSIMTRFSYLFTLLLVLLQLVRATDHVTPEELLNVLKRCRVVHGPVCNTSTDGLQPTYRRNLEQLFRSLADSISSTGFYNTSVGSPPYTAYGLVQCRGDVPLDICRNCTAVAAEKVKANCSGSAYAASIWIEPCFVRFDNTRFFGIPDGSEEILLNISHSNITDEVDAKAMMYPLVKAAANSPKLFATKEEPRNGYTCYGMAQCVRDLSPTDCRACFDRSTKLLEAYGSLGQNWWFFSRNCWCIYVSTWNFFLPSPPLSLMPAAAPPSPSMSAVHLPQPPFSPPVPLISGPDGRDENGNKRKTVIVIIVSSTVGMLLLATGIFILLFCGQKRETFKEELRRYSSEIASFGNLTEQRNHELPQYSLKALQAATNNFSEENKLGRGGFGPVYKGELNGRLVAVKRLSEHSGQGLKEFMNEVMLISKLQHKNLVCLLGYCKEREEKMLIYEFMPNGSLDAFFYDPHKRNSLDWEKRFNIILGSARAILYLHQDSRLNIIHRDLKAGNVLLDEQMVAKISDFGMARIFTGDNDPRDTDIIVGTHGYMAPEYAIQGKFSIKSYVYSFGVLLLEIVSGQTCSGFHLLQMDCNLTGYAWTLWSSGRMLDFIDPVLGESAPSSQVLKCLHIGLLCVQEDPANRPTMSGIINMLESDSLILPTPQHPPLVFSSSISNSSNSTTNKNDSSKSGRTNSKGLSRSKHSFR